ncbi:LysM peptidoglycan-binding domain-containing protein [Streptomyces sp. NBC_00536]|uniref:LysM peptidoglycan-binding domain-containing protein n=1 Tax=Streptomyces sp. NBC_00536 TaxID=2975769 RepID=UPI002E80AC87|nr:LysM peptidoglycan-binding domain-containing protein [Streptomyces sp. NBC_00536]WUC82591.1 LysM peptidoglycan-binding domain-containing protein [Streptomyces sp. NBC_00536]
MSASGKHRRPKTSPLARLLAVAGTGGIALALPLISASGAQAAQPTATTASTTTAKATGAKATAPAAAAPKSYSVVAGDTLSKIAESHSVSGGWKKLYEDNRSVIGSDPSVIRPGITLTIGGPAKATSAAATAKTLAASRNSTAAADRSARPTTLYANNLDGWIRQSLEIMAQHGIPGTYDGIHRNVLRESSGNPLAINNWDSNAAAGIPSKGLLQVIDPTFRAYHVPGTAADSYDPVANITAACNYAAARYGSIDNVNSAY